jgi:hypothetical protein
MNAIAAALPPGDGVACFNRMYLQVTEAVKAALSQKAFEDLAFTNDLDVAFGNLYFSAMRAQAQSDGPDGPVPQAWAPLFENRSRSGVDSLQFALAGMNAHINRDLAVALLTTCQNHRVAPVKGGPQHDDFLKINEILKTVELKVKPWILSGSLEALDQLVHRADGIDDSVALFSIVEARNAAWDHAEILWGLLPTPDLRNGYVQMLDRMVGFASRCLLFRTSGVSTGQ